MRAEHQEVEEPGGVAEDHDATGAEILPGDEDHVAELLAGSVAAVPEVLGLRAGGDDANVGVAVDAE